MHIITIFIAIIFIAIWAQERHQEIERRFERLERLVRGDHAELE